MLDKNTDLCGAQCRKAGWCVSCTGEYWSGAGNASWTVNTPCSKMDRKIKSD